MFILFLRFAGLGPFLNLQAKDGVTLTLRILSSLPTQNWVKASKITANYAPKEYCSPQSNVDQVSIASDDVATFCVNISQPVEMLELEVNSGAIPQRRLYLPVAMFSNPPSENPGKVIFPTEKGEGAVRIEFLTSTALPSPISAKLASFVASPSVDYFSKARSLVFGHRGMGITFKNFFKKDAQGGPVVNPYTENTVESFNAVAEVGGDGFEFDVVLTKDLVPVIYHDFFVVVRAETRSCGQFVKIPVHSLSYAETRTLQLYHAGVMTAVETRPDLSPEMFRLPKTTFEPLEDILRKVNPKLALNLEVKYPQSNAENGHECPGYHSRNVVADQILSVLANHAGVRPIVISSFDFDACLVFSSKQAVWPVAALTQGKTKKWVPFADLRTRSTESTAQFAKTSNIWGISAHAEDLVADTSLLSYVRKTVGVAMMVWGDDVANPQVAASFMPKGSENVANIIITDDPAGVVKTCKP